MNKILVVEDDDNFRKAAQEAIENSSFARDYSEAVARLNSEKYTGVITDCFFPQKTGSGLRDLGLSLIEELALDDSHEVKVREIINRVGGLVNLDTETKPIIRRWANASVSYNSDIEPAIRALGRCSRALGKDAAAKIARNTFGLMYFKEDSSPKDYFGALDDAIRESEYNQPLGILIAREADKLGLPFVLATSTNHHDVLTQPIQNYCSRNNWTLVDCGKGREADKETTEFWRSAYSVLTRKMEEGK